MAAPSWGNAWPMTVFRTSLLCRASELHEAVAKSPKVTVILHDDFSTYPQELLDRVKGCLWWVLVLLWKVSILLS